MFSSNQVLEISGGMDQIEAAIGFALKYSGHTQCFTRIEQPSRCVFQTTADGRYCIGWALRKEETPEGWAEFPFDYDAAIIARIVRQWLEKTPLPHNDNECYDGTSKLGFLLQESGGCRWKERERIKTGSRCIVTIRPYWCFYAK